MSEERLLKILLKAHQSEKGTRAESLNQFVFQVAPKATKTEIKQAVEKVFDVAVRAVQVVNIRGKKTTFKRVAGQRKGSRKAYVSLKEGNTINLGGKP